MKARAAKLLLGVLEFVFVSKNTTEVYSGSMELRTTQRPPIM
jgi:hypothetical protein